MTRFQASNRNTAPFASYGTTFVIKTIFYFSAFLNSSVAPTLSFHILQAAIYYLIVPNEAKTSQKSYCFEGLLPNIPPNVEGFSVVAPYVWRYPRIIVSKSHENTSKYVDTVTFFCKKNLNQRSLTPRWPLTPHLLRSHVWLYLRIIVSRSHGNTSMYVDTVINFANYHIHTHTIYVHTTYILRTESVIT